MMQPVFVLTASTIATVLVALFAVVTIAICVMTTGYTARPPSGSDAMALAGPVLGGAAAWTLLLIAAWLVLACGGFAWLPGPSAVRGTLVTVAVVGVFLVAARSFFHWTDHGLRGVVPLAGTTLVPLLLAGVVAWCAWMRPQTPSAVGVLRTLWGLMAVVAVVGLWLGAAAVVRHVAKQNRIAERRALAEAEQVAENRRWDALSPLEQTRETLSSFAADGDIAVPCTLLRSASDPAIERAVLDYARQRPDFESVTADALASPHSEYRHGMLRIVALDGRRPEAWRVGVHKAIALLTQDVATRGCYDTQAREAAAAVNAAAGWPAWEFAGDFRQLRDAVGQSAVADGRDACLRALANVADAPPHE